MQRPTSPFAGLIRRLDRRGGLAEGDRRAIEALPYSIRTFPAGGHFIRDGDRPEACCLLLSGFACRYKITGEGARQILSFHLPGEFVDLQNSLLGVADHSVQALTESEAAVIPRQALRDLAMTRPAIGRALWVDTLIDASIFREWVVNVGRRDSRARVAICCASCR
jgi:CRP-like cAMP-binding protein